MEGIISLESILAGGEVLFSLWGMLCVFCGVLVGILIGATPGLSPSMGVALLVPFSYGMDPAHAFIFFIAAYQAANYGGSITAIVLHVPGTPASIVTAMDGYKMTERGEAEKALGTALISSTIGGLFGACILIAAALPLARLGLLFGPAEYFSLAFFGLATVVAFSRGKMLKSALALGLGLLLSTVGTDPFSGMERFTFGSYELYDGINFLPVMIGVFALGELMSNFEKEQVRGVVKSIQLTKLFPPFSLVANAKKILFQSSLLGTGIGIIPGAGATIASFIAYAKAKGSSSQAEDFGNGASDGVIASEAANSSSVGGALVPLLALGIPGSATDAVLLGALSLHGLVAGPELFRTNPEVVYGILLSLFVANLVIYLLGSLGNRFWLKVISLPQAHVTAFIFCLCFLGSFTVKNSLIDVWVCFAAGIMGWAMKQRGYSPAALILGLVLGAMLETNLRRALLIGGWQMLVIDKPVSAALLILSALLIFGAVWKNKRS